MRSKAFSKNWRGLDEYAESTVRRYYEIVDAGDFMAVTSLFAPDIIYERPGYEPMVGLEQVLAFYTSVRAIECGTHELRLVLSDGPFVAVAGTFRGQVRGRGQITQGFADFFTFSNGRIKARSTYFDAPAV